MKLTLFGLDFSIKNHKDEQKKEVSQAQKLAAKSATKIRSKKAKEKIENAINLLKSEGKNLSNYAIAKESGCSINTVKKYVKYMEYMEL